MSVYIIAEAGVNHNGNLETAKEMALTAQKCGADAIKYQTFVSEDLVSCHAEKAEYQKKNTETSDSQLQMLKKLELSFEQFDVLERYCDEIGITFLSTPFDLKSIEFLNTFDMPFWKIPSGEITNVPYLIKIAETRKPVVMSTGMCNMEDVKFAVNLLKKYGVKEISLLHCNTEYPTPFEDVNLKAINTLKETFNCRIGYSDHTVGIEVSVAATAMGAEIIEKHFTLDRNMEGPDHKASLEPQELKYMVNAIRNIEKSLGNAEKQVSESEKRNIEIARKSIVASRDIRKGELLTEENITTKRPGTGITPTKWFDVVGSKAICDFKKDELIKI